MIAQGRSATRPPRHVEALMAPIATIVLCMIWAVLELGLRGCVRFTWAHIWYTASGTAFAGVLMAPIATILLLLVLAPVERFLERHATKAREIFLGLAVLAYALLFYWIARFTVPRVGVRLPRLVYVLGLAIVGMAAVAIVLRQTSTKRGLSVRLHLVLSMLVAYWFHVQAALRGGVVYVLSGAAMHALLFGVVVVSLCRRAQRPRRWLVAEIACPAILVALVGLVFPFEWKISFAARHVVVAGSYVGRNAMSLSSIVLSHDGLGGLEDRMQPAALADLEPFRHGGREVLDALRARRARNLLLITVDTLRYDDFHDDRLATFRRLRAEGVTFEHARTAATLTRLSLRALFLGGHRADGPTLSEVLRGAGFHTVEVTPWAELARDVVISRGFDRIEDATLGLFDSPGTGPAMTDVLLRRLANEPRPFFAWIHYLDPHAPYDAPGWSDRARYRGELVNVDAAVGRLLDGLAAAGRLDETLVILTADHGEEFGEHGSRFHGHTLYDEVLRVPLVMRGPGGQVHGAVDLPASTVDLGPTLLPVLGVPRPPGFAPEGEDLAKAAVDRSQLSSGRRHVAALAGSWKLIFDRQYASAELFNLENDPDERINLVDQRPDVASMLAEVLARFAN